MQYIGRAAVEADAIGRAAVEANTIGEQQKHAIGEQLKWMQSGAAAEVEANGEN